MEFFSGAREVQVRNGSNIVVDQAQDNVVGKFNDDFSMLCIQMKPDGWNVMPDVASGVEARTKIA